MSTLQTAPHLHLNSTEVVEYRLAVCCGGDGGGGIVGFIAVIRSELVIGG